jgi:hypothetical protein
VDETILDEQTRDPGDVGDIAVADQQEDAAEEPTAELLWREHLDRTTNESGRRLDRWIVDQRRRMADGLDSLLIDLERRREAEVARFEEWKTSEQRRIEQEIATERERGREQLSQELAAERERFDEQMLAELKAFEEQLGLRLEEHEARLARWWDEAEEMAARRFAALGLEGPEPS